MNNWVIRRALLGMLSIIHDALGTIRAVIPDDDCTPLQRAVTDAAFEVQLSVSKLDAAISKLPSS